MPRMSPSEQFFISLFARTFARAQAWLYRATGGKLGGTFAGVPVMVLTTVGRKSGQARDTPLLVLRDGEKLVTVASKGGYPSHPAWYLNLLAHPKVSVRLGSEERSMRAVTANAEERAHYWPKLVELYPSYRSYQEKTEREIPVVVLTPEA